MSELHLVVRVPLICCAADVDVDVVMSAAAVSRGRDPRLREVGIGSPKVASHLGRKEKPKTSQR